MKKLTVTEIFVLLAQARSPQNRSAALAYAVRSNRFDEEQNRILEELRAEANSLNPNMQTLRPLVNPLDENKDLLRLVPGMIPVLPDAIKAEVAEWVYGWNRETDLAAEQCACPGALLLHGPTGTGKSTVAASLANLLVNRPAVLMEAHRILDSFLGSTGKALAKAFETCQKTGALLVLEEIDGLAINRAKGSSSEVAELKRITVALMRLLDAATFPIVATTNMAEDMDPALLRRFEFKLELLPLPEEKRREILAAKLGASPPADLVALPLNESIPLVLRLRRKRILNNAPCGAST